MTIDTHCHLTFPPLADDIQGVLARARTAGVTRIIVPAYDPPSWERIEALAAAHPGVVHPAYGLHPWQTHEPLDIDRLADLLRRPQTVAVGEVGLDSKIDGPSMDVQLSVLERQLTLASDLDLPVILHCRGAFEVLLTLLARFAPGLRGVVHAWTRSPELAGRFLALGLHLGVGGAVTRPRARQTHATVRTVPLDRLVLETDAPSIGLEGVKPEKTEPRHVAEAAAAIAELRDVDVDHVAQCTTETAVRLFGLPGSPPEPGKPS